MVYTLGELTACIKKYCQQIAELMALSHSHTSAIIYPEFYAGGANAKSGGDIWTRNATITPNAAIVGSYFVTFSTPHPDGDEYHISLSGGEDNQRDNPKVTWIEGTKSAAGFNVMVTVDDNGGTADSYNDALWSFGVTAPVSVLVT